MRGRACHLAAARWIIPANHQISLVSMEIRCARHAKFPGTAKNRQRSMHVEAPGSSVTVPAGEELPIRRFQATDPGSLHAAHDHIIAAIPKAVVRQRINVLSDVLRGQPIAAELHEIRRRETPSWEHRCVIVQVVRNQCS